MMTSYLRTPAFKLGRKGFVGDWVTILVFLFLAGVTFVFMAYLLTTTNTALQADDSIAQEGKDILAQGEGSYPGMMDAFLSVFFFGLPIVTAALAWFLATDNPFLWLFFAATFVFVLIAAALANSWHYITDVAILQDTVTRFPLTDFVLNNFAMYALLVGAMIAFGLYMRTKSQ